MSANPVHNPFHPSWQRPRQGVPSPGGGLVVPCGRGAGGRHPGAAAELRGGFGGGQQREATVLGATKGWPSEGSEG